MEGRRKLGELLRGLCAPHATASALWEQIIQWPPDLFAVTSMLLESSNYQRLVDPDATNRWPPTADWQTTLRTMAARWRKGLTDATPVKKWHPEFVKWLTRHRKALVVAATSPSDELPEMSWANLRDLVELHALADEACEHIAVPGPSTAFDFECEFRLIASGSLSTFPTELVRVVPKLHTPQRGMTLRSLSHHVSALRRSGFRVSWSVSMDEMISREAHADRELGLLLIPWPFEVESKAVRQARRPIAIDMPASYGFFDFDPSAAFDASLVTELVDRVRADGQRVDGIVFPEASLTHKEHERVVKAARAAKVNFVLAGVRGQQLNRAVLTAPQTQTRWQYAQDKHHRWCLERNQLQQYGFDLPSDRVWWENIHIPEREICFVSVTDWLTMCHVVCEDLARLDPVDQVIRAVGPNLLVALLQDGPQIAPRWANRFASVYADDPGCSVLILTSLGMATRCRRVDSKPAGRASEPSRVVGRWIDKKGAHELVLPKGSQGIYLQLRPYLDEEFTADGRSDRQSSAHLERTSHWPVAVNHVKPLTRRRKTVPTSGDRHAAPKRVHRAPLRDRRGRR